MHLEMKIKMELGNDTGSKISIDIIVKEKDCLDL